MPKRVPKIRFKKYTDEWEENLLSEFLEVSKEKNFLEKYDKTDVLSVSGECGIVNQIEHKGRSFAGASVANYGVVNTGDVVYTKSPLLNTPYGIIKTNKGKPGIVSTLYAVYKPKENVDPNFIECYFEQNARINNYLKPLVNKGAKNDMKVTDENALKGLVLFPNKKEQEEITKCLEKFANLISDNQQRYDKIISIKKAFLDSLFANKGNAQPNLRFKNFKNNWRKYKLGYFFNERNERSSIGDLISVTINSGVIRTEDLNKIDNSSADKSKYKKVEINDIAYNSMRMWQGASGCSKYNGILSPAYTVCKPKDNCNSLFFSYLFKRQEIIHIFEINSQGIARDTWNLKFPKFSEIETYVPEYNEQIEIGKFLDIIDKLADLYSKKIDKLTKIKKAFLEQIFV